MSRQPTGFGHIFERNGAWHTRFTIAKGKQRSVRICTKDALHAEKDSLSVVQMAIEIVKHHQTYGRCPSCGRFGKVARNLQGEAK